MVAKSNGFENTLLRHIFLNEALANIGNGAGLQPAGAAGNFTLALHTADPGEAGDQTTNEANYTSYARVNVARSGSGWTVTGNAAANAALVQFPTATGGNNTITYVSIGSGVNDEIIYRAPVTTPPAGLPVSDQIRPEFAIGSIAITEE